MPPTIIDTGHEPRLPGAAASTRSRRPAIAFLYNSRQPAHSQGHHLQGYPASLNTLAATMATDMLEAEPFQAIEVSRAPNFMPHRADVQAQDQHLDSAPEVQTPLTKSGVAPIKNPEAVRPFFFQHT